MNAAAESLPVNPVPARRTPAHKTHRFALLLRREFWEHKGGFFWAPMVAGGIFLLLALMGIVVGEVARMRAADHEVSIDGTRVTIGSLDLGMLTSKIRPEDMKHVADAIDMTLFMAVSWPLIVLAFVVFFYCLGALYDERKDRSVLFWKSLPVSDAETVLSKVASATVTAPLLALAAGIATMFGFLLLASICRAGAWRQPGEAAVGAGQSADHRRAARRVDPGLRDLGAADRRLAAVVLGVVAQQAVPVGDHDPAVHGHLRELVRHHAALQPRLVVVLEEHLRPRAVQHRARQRPVLPRR